jgi:NDP-sugar pyrophosphorylase family protein
VLEPEVLQRIPREQAYDFGGDVFPALLATGHRLYGTQMDGYLLDIGAPERYWQAEADYANGQLGRARRRVLASTAGRL